MTYEVDTPIGYNSLLRTFKGKKTQTNLSTFETDAFIVKKHSGTCSCV